jgi:hypothetical protein
MTAVLVIAFIVGAVVAFSAVDEAIRRMERAIEAHDRDEADLEAMADATREPPPWSDEQIERLRLAIEKEGEQ